MLNDETRNRVRHFMRDFAPDLIAAKNQSGVLIIGDTKVGKSTLANALDPETEFFYDVGFDSPRARNPRRVLAAMGIDNARSQTEYPACYRIGEAFVIVDFPGMRDTGLQKRPPQAFSMFLTKETLREVKGVMVMLDQGDLEAGRFELLIAVLDDLHKIFSARENFPILTFIVSTKNVSSRVAAPALIFRRIANIRQAWTESAAAYRDFFIYMGKNNKSPVRSRVSVMGVVRSAVDAVVPRFVRNAVNRGIEGLASGVAFLSSSNATRAAGAGEPIAPEETLPSKVQEHCSGLIKL